MIAAFLGDEAARQFDDVAPDDGSDQRAGAQRLSEINQAAEGMIHPRKILFQVPADFR